MSFFNTLQSLGLWPQQGQPQENPYGLDDAAMRQARMQSLGNLGSQLLAASMPMTSGQRANLMQGFDATGGYQTNLYNAAQLQLLGDKRRQDAEEAKRTQAATEWLQQRLSAMPDSPQKQKAMIFLQLGDVQKAADAMTEGPAEGKPPEMKTIRVGDQDVTYQWDPGAKQWVKFGEGMAFKPDAPPDGPKPSDRLAIADYYEKAPETLAYNTVLPILKSLAESVDDPSKASDLAFVYGVAKAMDPGSVVRDSEGQMVVDTQGLAPKLVGYINSVQGGGQLSPASRRELFNLVRSRAKQYQAQAESRRQYALRLGRNGLVTEDDLRPVEPLPDAQLLRPTGSDQPVALPPDDESFINQWGG